uniref:Uncharacterized protein n=1 Tax=Glossina pallidipes TaxID=7398 RepID=A0A1B0A0K7_GLOPL
MKLCTTLQVREKGGLSRPYLRNHPVFYMRDNLVAAEEKSLTVLWFTIIGVLGKVFIHDNFLGYVRSATNAMEICPRLCASFEPKRAQGQALVRRGLSCLRLQEDGNHKAMMEKQCLVGIKMLRVGKIC